MLKPYYQDDAVTLYHGDNREIVPQLGRFDLLLTDPRMASTRAAKSKNRGRGTAWQTNATTENIAGTNQRPPHGK